MSNSPQSRANYAARRDLRLRRDKTAALLLPFFLGREPTISSAVYDAVSVADALLAELDRTRKDLAATLPQGEQT